MIREHSSAVEHLPYKQALHLVRHQAVRIWYKSTEPFSGSRVALPRYLCHTRDMNTTQTIKSVRITNGKAFRWGTGRWFPMNLAKAQLLIASGEVEDCSGCDH